MYKNLFPGSKRTHSLLIRNIKNSLLFGGKQSAFIVKNVGEHINLFMRIKDRISRKTLIFRYTLYELTQRKRVQKCTEFIIVFLHVFKPPLFCVLCELADSVLLQPHDMKNLWNMEVYRNPKVIKLGTRWLASNSGCLTCCDIAPFYR